MRKILKKRFLVACALALALGASQAQAQKAEKSDKATDVNPLTALEFYVGKWRPLAGSETDTVYDLEWALDKKMIKWIGYHKGETKPYVEGFMSWDPVEKKIFKTNVYIQGFLSRGEVRMLSNNMVERNFIIHYPDGNAVPFRDRWTPKSDDTFEWVFEIYFNGVWQPYPIKTRPTGPLQMRIIRE